MFARIKAFLLITVYLFIAVAVVPSTASAELLWPYEFLELIDG